MIRAFLIAIALACLAFALGCISPTIRQLTDTEICGVAGIGLGLLLLALVWPQRRRRA